MEDVFAAFSLLTIVPVRRKVEYSARALGFFPIVGMIIGLVLYLFQSLISYLFSASIPAVLVLALWVILTGALHLDGFSDACDGLFAATTPERRLAILRDVHLGAFGAVGLIVLLLAKFTALNESNPAMLFLAPLVARWAMVYAAAFPLARQAGMAAMFTKGLTRREITIATLLTALGVLPFGWLGAAALVTALLVATIIARFAMVRLGGLTGDIYGMVCEGVEVGVLLVGALHI